ncbi:chorismate mutase [Zavarzinia sp. CC-PAN008]|uniref:chorismate mutase n=1 Tax=Zavarzinia sp. CC-PAN008 TaxID=3243332 RepID=UPI003F745C10
MDPTHPTQYTTMAQVRAEVDRLDSLIVPLLARRQACIEAAARIKPSRAVVRDEARIADVIAKVRAAAQANEADPALLERIYRAMMEAFIAHEEAAFDQHRAD